MKIEGLDKLTKMLDDVQRALSEIDGELGSVSFDPSDPASIEAAIQDAEHMIEERVGSHAANPLVASLVEGMKEQFRAGIVERAAAARLASDTDGD